VARAPCLLLPLHLARRGRRHAHLRCPRRRARRAAAPVPPPHRHTAAPPRPTSSRPMSPQPCPRLRRAACRPSAVRQHNLSTCSCARARWWTCGVAMLSCLRSAICSTIGSRALRTTTCCASISTGCVRAILPSPRSGRSRRAQPPQTLTSPSPIRHGHTRNEPTRRRLGRSMVPAHTPRRREHGGALPFHAWASPPQPKDHALPQRTQRMSRCSAAVVSLRRDGSGCSDAGEAGSTPEGDGRGRARGRVWPDSVVRAVTVHLAAGML
jgi:hypothetical protein